MAVRLELRKGASRLVLYDAQQSSSLVKAATVRMAPAASQAKWAEFSWAVLLT